MILLVDASAVVDLLVRTEHGARVRRFLTQAHEITLMTAAHLDAEVLSALARLNRADILTDAEVQDLLGRLADLAMQRLPITGSLLRAAWDLRGDIAARDALYVAAAGLVGGRLLTTDDRLARALPELAVDLG